MAAKKAWVWFDALWEMASPVEDTDIAQAAARWEKEALSDSPYRRSSPLADLKLSDEWGRHQSIGYMNCNCLPSAWSARSSPM
jgi:hypothetical protein